MSTVTAPDLYTDEVAISSEQDRTRLLFNPLFWVGCATAGSAFRVLRFEVAGMAFHPYMAALFLLIFRAIPNIHHFPARVGRPAAVFFILYVISLVQGTSFVIQLTKISVMALTLIFITVSVKSYDDFVAGAMGLGVCAVILCIRGFIRGPGSFGSINPIEGSQKNAFSLFYLPGLTLSIYLILSPHLSSRKLFFALVTVIIFAGILLSKNRSGWLAAGALIFLVFNTNRQRVRFVVFVAVFGLLALLISGTVTAEADVVLERDAVNAAHSDELRVQLVIRAISIGLQHPLFGVSPSKLTLMLGEIAKVDDVGIDCHNVTGYLIGGSGLPAFIAFCIFAYAMFRAPRKFLFAAADPLAVYSARMLSTMTAIWMIRAQFQEDVLFSPTFTVGLGLCIGLCMSTGVYSSRFDPYKSQVQSV